MTTITEVQTVQVYQLFIRGRVAHSRDGLNWLPLSRLQLPKHSD
jgi:hypothetical protein